MANDIPENYVPTFFEIVIPEEFFVVECKKCEYFHAPVRDCPETDPVNDFYDPPMHRWE